MSNSHPNSIVVVAPDAPDPLDVLGTEQPTPTATGNTTNKNTVFKDANGDTWIVDSNGDAIKTGRSTDATGQNVYFNGTNPNTATIFDNANPPVTNDDTLKENTANTFFGTDGSAWIWNSVTGQYETKVFTYASHEFEVKTATASQTSVTLAKTPILGATGKVRVSRNGVDITRAWTWVGNVGTYNPANNYGCTIDAGNILQFEYEAA
jgi:hypothetical protein